MSRVKDRPLVVRPDTLPPTLQEALQWLVRWDAARLGRSFGRDSVDPQHQRALRHLVRRGYLTQAVVYVVKPITVAMAAELGWITPEQADRR